MWPPARINTAPRPNECGREPESAYLGIRSLLHRHSPPVCTALSPFTPALKCNTPKVILNTLGVFPITPKVLSPTPSGWEPSAVCSSITLGYLWIRHAYFWIRATYFPRSGTCSFIWNTRKDGRYVEEKIFSSILWIVNKYRQYEHFCGRWKRLCNFFALSMLIVTLLPAVGLTLPYCQPHSREQSTVQPVRWWPPCVGLEKQILV